MINDNTIILYSDLEGTLLNEDTRDFDSEHIWSFLKELQNIQENTEKSISINIVSPTYPSSMENYIKKLDNYISEFNRKNTSSRRLDYVNAGISYYSDEFDKQSRDRRVIPLFEYNRFSKSNQTLNMKKNFIVENIIRFNNLKDIQYMYLGNGTNDLEAMKFINSQGGITCCPNNSKTTVKQIATYQGTSTDIKGIAEALKSYNIELEKRKGISFLE